MPPAEDVRHLQPRQFPAQPAQNHFVDSHGSLPCLAREGHRHLLGSDLFHARADERSCHVLLPSGQMMCSLHMEGIAIVGDQRTVYFHVLCFYMWDDERSALEAGPTATRLNPERRSVSRRAMHVDARAP